MKIAATIRPLADNTQVLIVDEHPLFAEALRDCVAEIDGVGAFTCSPDDLLDTFRQQDFDVVVCDPTIQARFSTELIKSLRRRFPNCRLMVLTAHAEANLVISAIASGAQSFVLKSEPIHTIKTAIELVCRGGVALSLPVAGLLVSREVASRVEPSLASLGSRGLSPREIEVIELVARGYSDNEIAQRLAISARTAQQHVSNVMRKLDCRSRSEAVARLVGRESRLACDRFDSDSQ
jgi:DNA-binding NarL/FixJ family response regulator